MLFNARNTIENTIEISWITSFHCKVKLSKKCKISVENLEGGVGGYISTFTHETSSGFVGENAVWKWKVGLKILKYVLLDLDNNVVVGDSVVLLVYRHFLRED